METIDNINFPQLAMDIILPAGNARTCVMDALDFAQKEQLTAADKKVEEAFDYLKTAHQAQTDVLQRIASYEYEHEGRSVSIPMIFIHAQDTLMSIMTEVNLASKMINMYKTVMEKINNADGNRIS
ncbi:MAG: PTS lactose/cellobiose transporter subunit IIA [Bulleidia sp.]